MSALDCLKIWRNMLSDDVLDDFDLEDDDIKTYNINSRLSDAESEYLIFKITKKTFAKLLLEKVRQLNNNTKVL